MKRDFRLILLFLTFLAFEPAIVDKLLQLRVERLDAGSSLLLLANSIGQVASSLICEF